MIFEDFDGEAPSIDVIWVIPAREDMFTHDEKHTLMNMCGISMKVLPIFIDARYRPHHLVALVRPVCV
jgi:hypothetical protein